MNADDDLVLLEDEHPDPAGPRRAWKLLIVDDEPEVHRVTEMALKNFEYRDRGLEIINAYSAAEAKEKLAETDDIAMMLLDVVMETEHAGLDLTNYVRNDLENNHVRIILRTGQPGQAPPREVVREYDISEYCDKSELTAHKLDTILCTGIAMYEQIGELHRSNRDLEHFAYVVSHDLQEPLRAVTSFVRLLRAAAADKLGEEEHEYLDFISNGAQRLHDMIQSLLSLSRLSTQAGAYQTVDLNQVVAEAISDLTESMEATGAVVDYQGLPSLKMDGVQAVVLFRNLIGNSIRYAQEDVPPHIGITFESANNGWIFRVKDNGIGFSQEDAERIFDIFTRLHRSDQYEGTGIGLALCQKIVRRHGGTISAESAPGEGATFIIYLPETPEE